MITKLVTSLALLVITNVYAGDLPNPAITPGAINPDVIQANIQQTICIKGFTKTIRPRASYTNKVKKQQIHQYGYADANPKHYEEDHLIALSIGGAPDDVKNLWPEPRNSEWNAAKKDQLEITIYKMVCANQISLVDAQQAMSGNWIEAWKKYVQVHH
ncbi:hypothetical protein ACO0K0_16305 [Undibacterium sp. SXout11W]|uniref:hypothetical protein n=1 Tax=Undibacterium sp. SXout11W TaxID=3413050 RepID=UPI003BF10B49